MFISDWKSPFAKGAEDGLAGASAADGALISSVCLQLRIYWWEQLEGKITSITKISTCLRFSLSGLFSATDSQPLTILPIFNSTSCLCLPISHTFSFYFSLHSHLSLLFVVPLSRASLSIPTWCAAFRLSTADFVAEVRKQRWKRCMGVIKIYNYILLNPLLLSCHVLSTPLHQTNKKGQVL